jgi:hypothetical protein
MLAVMFPAPPMPAFAPGQSAVTTAYPRFEDVAQDGRLMPLSLPWVLGGLWREVLVDNTAQRAAIQQGILPILTRLTLISTGQAVRVDRQVESRAGYELAHSKTPAGDVARIYMNVWAEVRGTVGKLSRQGSAPPNELALGGTLFAEHTFTRLLGPPDQRSVTRFEVEGYPTVPEAHYAAPAPATAQDLPEGATWLDELAPDSADYAFTLDHTDSNQHVNSLTYIRIFLDAVYRRLAAAKHPGRLRSRAVDIAYRKPSFAGDRVRSALRLFQRGDELGAAGTIAGDDGKPRCYVRCIVGT